MFTIAICNDIYIVVVYLKDVQKKTRDSDLQNTAKIKSQIKKNVFKPPKEETDIPIQYTIFLSSSNQK